MFVHPVVSEELKHTHTEKLHFIIYGRLAGPAGVARRTLPLMISGLIISLQPALPNKTCMNSNEKLVFFTHFLNSCTRNDDHLIQ